jgi:hypothetical protein
LTWLVPGVLVVTVTAGGAVLLGAAANAAPAPGSLGALTFIPATGSDTTIITATTSAGCDAAASAADLEVTGPVGSADPVFPPGTVITSTETNTFSTTGSFDVPEGNSLKTAADILKKTLVAGEYDLTVHCQDQFTNQNTPGNFTGAIFFTDPTTYNTGSTQPPSGSPSPSPVPSPVASPTPSPMPTNPPTPTPSATSDTSTATPTASSSDAAGATTSSGSGSAGTQAAASTGNLANTGAPIALIFLGAMILFAAGLMLVVWMKRPKKADLSDGDDTSER